MGSMDVARSLCETKRPYRLIMLKGADQGITEHHDERA
jgi:hypothetical protein